MKSQEKQEKKGESSKSRRDKREKKRKNRVCCKGQSSLKSKFDAEQFTIMVCNIISGAALENGQL